VRAAGAEDRPVKMRGFCSSPTTGTTPVYSF